MQGAVLFLVALGVSLKSLSHKLGMGLGFRAPAELVE